MCRISSSEYTRPLRTFSLLYFFVVSNSVCIFHVLGLTLDKNKPSDSWDPDVRTESNDATAGYRGEHTLLVKQVRCFTWYSRIRV